MSAKSQQVVRGCIIVVAVVTIVLALAIIIYSRFIRPAGSAMIFPL